MSASVPYEVVVQHIVETVFVVQAETATEACEAALDAAAEDGLDVVSAGPARAQ